MDKRLKRANKILGTKYEDWETLSEHRGLTEDFIREFADNVWWGNISEYQHLSEDFIREFKDRIDWFYISQYQHLSEDFIREFQDKVDWYWISSNQHLSEDFIREFADRVNWGCISEYQRLSYKFIEEFKDKLDMHYVTDSWHHISTEEKKRAVMDTGLYECYEDYFIAYKGIRSDRYSNFNFHYQYLRGHTYETWCDCSDGENSFGFSAWTESGARDYCNELVVRIKVRYEDVGRVAHNGGKIRCFKLEVLD